MLKRFWPQVTTQWSLDWVFRTFLLLLHLCISGEKEGKIPKSRWTSYKSSKTFCLLFENVLVSLWNTCKWKYQEQYRTLNGQLNNQFIITRGPRVKSLHSFTSYFIYQDWFTIEIDPNDFKSRHNWPPINWLLLIGLYQ